MTFCYAIQEVQEYTSEVHKHFLCTLAECVSADKLQHHSVKYTLLQVHTATETITQQPAGNKQHSVTITNPPTHIHTCKHTHTYIQTYTHRANAKFWHTNKHTLPAQDM